MMTEAPACNLATRGILASPVSARTALAVAAIPAAALTCGPLSSFVHAQGPIVKHGPGELRDRPRGSVLCAHFDEREALALAGIAIGDDMCVH